jgi:hypothetical protein
MTVDSSRRANGSATTLPKSSGSEAASIQAPPPYKRSATTPLQGFPLQSGSRNSQESRESRESRVDGMFAPPAGPPDLIQSNNYAARKLFDQIQSSLPHRTRVDFEVDGESYEAAALGQNQLYLNSTTHQRFGRIDLATGQRTYLNDEEKTARLLAAASARLQYMTS